jgi:hypothetical protein
MGWESLGADFFGGGSEGASSGAAMVAGLGRAGINAGPYAIPLIAGQAGLGVLGKVLGGLADGPAERLNMRLGKQEYEMNSIAIEDARRKQQLDREQKKKADAFNGLMSRIFGGLNVNKGATP